MVAGLHLLSLFFCILRLPLLFFHAFSSILFLVSFFLARFHDAHTEFGKNPAVYSEVNKGYNQTERVHVRPLQIIASRLFIHS
jgi:hypothetical protein